MERLDRITGWLIFGIGMLHCGVTFLLFKGYSDAAMWFFSGGLAMMYSAALNLLRVRYADVAPGLRKVCAAVNFSLLAFIVAYSAGEGARIFWNFGAVTLIICAIAVTAFSLFRGRQAAQN